MCLLDDIHSGLPGVAPKWIVLALMPSRVKFLNFPVTAMLYQGVEQFESQS